MALDLVKHGLKVRIVEKTEEISVGQRGAGIMVRVPSVDRVTMLSFVSDMLASLAGTLQSLGSSSRYPRASGQSTSH